MKPGFLSSEFLLTAVAVAGITLGYVPADHVDNVTWLVVAYTGGRTALKYRSGK